MDGGRKSGNFLCVFKVVLRDSLGGIGSLSNFFLSLCEMLLVIEHRAVGQKAHPARETGCTLASDFIHDRMNLKMTTFGVRRVSETWQEKREGA